VSPGELPIAVEYDLTERDVVQARLWFLRRNKALLAVGALVVLLVGGYIAWSSICGAELWSLFPFFLLLAFWVVFLPLATILGSKRFYRTLLESERHTLMRFGPDHFEHEDGESSGRHSWRIVQSAGETPHAFYFLHRNSLLRVIPKRAFRATGDIDHFRTLLRSVLGDRAHQLALPEP